MALARHGADSNRRPSPERSNSTLHHRLSLRLRAASAGKPATAPRSIGRPAGRFEKTSRGTSEPDSHPSRGCVLPRKARHWSGQPKYPNSSPPEINAAQMRTKTFPGELRGGRPFVGRSNRSSSPPGTRSRAPTRQLLWMAGLNPAMDKFCRGALEHRAPP